MGTPAPQALYKDRAATAECVNAMARNSDVAVALEPMEVTPKVPRLVGNRVDLRLVTVGPQASDHQGAVAVVNGHKDAILLQDRPPFGCGSVPPGTTHVILR